MSNQKIAVSKEWVKELTERGLRSRMRAAEQAGGTATTAFQGPMDRAVHALKGEGGVHQRMVEATRAALAPGDVTDLRAARKNLLHVDHLAENRAAQMDALSRAHEQHLRVPPATRDAHRKLDDALREFNAPRPARPQPQAQPQPSVAAATVGVPVAPPAAPSTGLSRPAMAAAGLGGAALLGGGAYLASRPDEKTAAYRAGYSSILAVFSSHT